MNVPSVLFFALLLFSGEAKDYKIIKVQKLNWHAAFQDCMSRGLQLATVHSQEEQADIEAAIKKAGISNEWLWTSGTDQGEEGNFFWMSTAEPIIYSKWSNPQPDNAGGFENCVHIWNNGGGLTWNDWGCGNKLYYICEPKQCSQSITVEIKL